MKSKIVVLPVNCLKASLISAVLISAAWSTTAQPETLAVRQTGNQVTVSWQASLGLVQPQRSTNLTVGAWQDFGLATSESALVDTAGSASAFYRLRFLPPTIVTQPLGQSVAAGGKAGLSVAATGTAPLSFQWRRNETNLAGQVTASLDLANALLADAGAYSVVVANRAGAVTSSVAALTVTSSVVTALLPGIYLGNFSAQTNGGFAAMLRSNSLAVVLANNVVQSEGVLVTNVAVASDGSFALTGEKTGKLNGKFAIDSVTGTLASTNGLSGAFTGARRPDTGIQASNAGYYAGTFDGLLSGNVYAILAADGNTFVYLSTAALGGGGTLGSIDASNSYSATTAYTLPGTTAPALIDVKGTLNATTHQFTGTYALGVIPLGKFSLTRVFTP